MDRDRLVSYLDGLFRVRDIPDDSLNGLQVEGSKRVEKVCFAVDACRETIGKACRVRAHMLVVHHGLFWGKKERATGITGKRLARLLAAGVSLYALHLPLDAHEELGNNAQLADLLGLEDRRKFGDYRGIEIGLMGAFPQPLARSRLAANLGKALATEVQVLPFGPARVKMVGVVSGAAASLVAEAAAAGCDTYVTGETSHASYHVAREAGLNVIYAGHYASETVGLKALASHLTGKFGLKCAFVSAPTGY